MNLIQLYNTIDLEIFEKLFSVMLTPGVAVGFATGTLLHLTGFAVFRVLALLNTK